MAPEAPAVRSAQAWLQSCQVQVPFVWLQACVQRLQDEAGGAGRFTQQQINKQVYDQWLLTDLRDLDHPVLPEGLAQSHKTLLNGIFCVQVDSVLDVSQPSYGQLQKWKGTDCGNDEVSAVTQSTQRPWEARPTRLLLLQVTDGVQNLEAMEYQPISALSTALRPGVKVRLQGDIPCRLGVMLLGPSNIKLLGGEVEDLVHRNHQSRVLCRALRLPEEEPQPQEEEPQPQEEEPPAPQGNQDFGDSDVDDQALLASLEEQELQDQADGRGQGGEGSARDSGYRTRLESTQFSGSSARNRGSTASSRSATVMSTSSVRNDILPSSSSRTVGSAWSLRPEQPDLPDLHLPGPQTQDHSTMDQDQSMMDQDFPDEDFDDLPLDELDSIIDQDPSTNPPPNLQLSTTAPSDVLDEDMDFMEDFDETGSGQLPHTTQTVSKAAGPVTLTSPPFTYLCLLDTGARTGKMDILVKAFIVTLLGKLTSSSGFWQMSVTISDGTDYLDVELSDEVLQGLLGFSVAEKAVLRRDPARKGELEAGLRRGQEELVDMCCIMNISLDREAGTAVVTRARPVKEKDLQELEERLKDAK